MSLTAPQVDWWIERLRRSGFDATEIEKNSQEMLKELFKVTDAIEAVGDDDRKQFWLRAPRGSFDAYKEEYDPEDYTEDELRKMFERDYPDEEAWYLFQSAHHTDTHDGEEFYGVFLANEYVLNINDPNVKGFPVDATELIEWLIESAKRVVSDLEKGIYNQEVKEKLPVQKKYGTILRRDYWDIRTDLREGYRGAFKEGEIDMFLAYAAAFPDDDFEEPREQCLSEMTARKYYEACGIAYRAVDYKERDCWRYKETDEERKRYGGKTPKELYYSYADGRDDGLMRVPMDDAEEFEKWKDQKGDYYEFNGHHPYEIRTSMSSRFTIHLYPCRIKEDNAEKWYFSLSGNEEYVSIETIKMYLALRKAGLPVCLYSGREMASRLAETDRIGILPDTVPAFYARYGDSHFPDDVLDHINLYNEDLADRIVAKAEWLEQEPVRLKTI